MAKKAEVKYDSTQISPEQIVTEISLLGYDAEVIPGGDGEEAVIDLLVGNMGEALTLPWVKLINLFRFITSKIFMDIYYPDIFYILLLHFLFAYVLAYCLFSSVSPCITFIL